MKSKQFQNLGDVYGENNIHYMSYPVYTDKEKKEYKRHPYRYFYEKKYLARDAQCSRILPIAGGINQIVIMPESAKSTSLMNYYQERYGKKHTGNFKNVHFFKDETGYISLIKKNTRKTNYPVVVLCPFLPHHIDPACLYVNAETLVYLNKKNNIHRLSEKVPQRLITTFNNFDKDFFENPLFHPCVIKGETGSGGDTVRIVQSLNGLLEAKRKMELAKTKRVIIEEYFEHDVSYNMQFCISCDGKISFLHLSVQKISKRGRFLGNLIDLDYDHRHLPHKMLHAAQEACKNIHEYGFHGLVGIDVLHREKDNRVRTVDINARWNASSTLLLLRKTIYKRSGDRYISALSLLPKKRNISCVDDALDDLSPELQKYLFLIGGANRMNKMSKYRYRIYAGITGNSEKEIQERINLLSKRYQVS